MNINFRKRNRLIDHLKHRLMFAAAEKEPALGQRSWSSPKACCVLPSKWHWLGLRNNKLWAMPGWPDKTISLRIMELISNEIPQRLGRRLRDGDETTHFAVNEATALACNHSNIISATSATNFYYTIDRGLGIGMKRGWMISSDGLFWIWPVIRTVTQEDRNSVSVDDDIDDILSVVLPFLVCESLRKVFSVLFGLICWSLLSPTWMGEVQQLIKTSVNSIDTNCKNRTNSCPLTDL